MRTDETKREEKWLVEKNKVVGKRTVERKRARVQEKMREKRKLTLRGDLVKKENRVIEKGERERIGC